MEGQDENAAGMCQIVCNPPDIVDNCLERCDGFGQVRLIDDTCGCPEGQIMTSIGSCRLPVASSECLAFYGDARPVYRLVSIFSFQGDCFPREQENCTNGGAHANGPSGDRNPGQILRGDGRCGLPVDGQECVDTPDVTPPYIGRDGLYCVSSCEEGKELDGVECIQELLSECDIGQVVEDGACADPDTGQECIDARGTDFIGISRDGGACVTECEAGEILGDGSRCRFLEIRDCDLGLALRPGEGCVEPRTGEECASIADSLSGRPSISQVDRFRFIGIDRETGECVLSCDDTDFFDEENLECRPFEEGDCEDGEILDVVCRAPLTGQECLEVNSDFIGVMGFENFIGIDDGVCVSECARGKDLDPNLVCQVIELEDCRDGEVVGEDGCRAPETGDECLGALNSNFVGLDPRTGQCVETCPHGDMSDELTKTCRAITLDDCDDGQFFDVLCLDPRTGQECVDAKNSNFVGIGGDGDCVAECPAPEQFLDNSLVCRDPAESAECAMLNASMPTYDRTTGSCRVPLTDAECEAADRSRPVFENGACRSEHPSECNPSAEIFVDGVCQPIRDEDRCSASEKFEGDRCVPLTAADCSASQAFVGGRCVLQTIDGCPAGQRHDAVSGECRQINAGDCLVGEYFDDSRCLPVTQAYCEAQGESLSDVGTCRALDEALDCIPLGRVLAGGSCVVPRSAADCIRLNATLEFFDAGACVANCPASKRADRENNCVGMEQSDCASRSMIADGGICRAPQNSAECSQVLGLLYDAGVCVSSCPPARPVIGEGNVCQAGAIAPVASDQSEADLMPIIPGIAAVAIATFAQGWIFSPLASYSSIAGGDTWTYGGRVNAQGENWTSYAAATRKNEESSLIYETGGSYSTGGAWTASYATRDADGEGDYGLALSAEWHAGAWRVKPNWRAGFAYDRSLEWESSNELALDALWSMHKWKMRPGAAFVWEDGSSASVSRIRVDIERAF